MCSLVTAKGGLKTPRKTKISTKNPWKTLCARKYAVFSQNIIGHLPKQIPNHCLLYHILILSPIHSETAGNGTPQTQKVIRSKLLHRPKFFTVENLHFL